MPTTTNYGWTTPADTDLVKDGASAIRTLGTAIDTTVFNNAGAAIAKSLVDAKGDLIAASAADTVVRVPVGTNGQYLKADSGATGGVSWDTLPAAGGMTLISTTTLSGSSVTLSSIPQTYKNLYLVMRNFKPSVDASYTAFRFNGDSTASRHNFSNVTESNANSFFDSLARFQFSSNDNSVDTGITIFTIPDYTNTTTWKFGHGMSFMVNATTTTQFNFNVHWAVYNQTSAISSLEFFPQSSGNFTSGTLLLYGVA